jgi:hypothetical protein
MSAVATLSANAGSTSGSRSRPQARKKPNDDAAYFGVAGTKRQAADRAEGEPRVKRKRVEHNTAVSRRADKSADNDLKSVVRGFCDTRHYGIDMFSVRWTSETCQPQGFIVTSLISISFHLYTHHP